MGSGTITKHFKQNVIKRDVPKQRTPKPTTETAIVDDPKNE
jgi:hypothetical protein